MAPPSPLNLTASARAGLLPLLLIAACAGGPTVEPEPAPAPETDAPPPPPRPVDLVMELAPKAMKMDGYGGYHLPVSGADAEAQSWFDQGLQLVYGFNHDAAVHCFAAAAAASPDCTMAWWGIAYAYGIDVNNPQVEAYEAARAYSAAQEALRLVEAGDATPVEAALVRAVAERAVYPLPSDRAPLDQAYSDAMARAYVAHPGNVDIATLYAESLMNLQPWDYWTADGEAVKRAEEIVAVLEGGISNNEMHPGANHFYIHAVEASNDPVRAVTAAERLEALVPGSGHLVHMPSHIYINVGRYADAADANTRAIEADAAYFDAYGEPTFYRLYFIHNIHFLAHAAMMEGRSQVAIDALRRMEAEVPEEFLRAFPQMGDGLMAAKFHGLIRFGRWQQVLDEPEYPQFRKASIAMRHYARAVALANLQRPAEAREELARFDAAAADTPEDWLIGVNPAATIYALARQMAEGEILWWEGRAEESFAMLRDGVAAEDALVYDEPPGWMIPVRHALGALLLAGDRPDEAIEVYRADLIDNPKNAWSLLGLQQALRAAGQVEVADAMDADVQAAWSRADVDPPASCYCGRKPA